MDRKDTKQDSDSGQSFYERLKEEVKKHAFIYYPAYYVKREPFITQKNCSAISIRLLNGRYARLARDLTLTDSTSPNAPSQEL